MQLHEYGTKLVFSTGLDLATTNALKLRFMPPRADSIEHDLDAGSITDRAAGTIQYTFADGDLPALGTYRVQAFDVTGGRFVPSKIGEFIVEANLPDPPLP